MGETICISSPMIVKITCLGESPMNLKSILRNQQEHACNFFIVPKIRLSCYVIVTRLKNSHLE